MTAAPRSGLARSQLGPNLLHGLSLLLCLSTPAFAESRPLSGGYNSLGVPGLIDMPSAFGRPDAEFATVVSVAPNQTRTNLTFQITPRLSGTFRYSALDDLRATANSAVRYDTFDRSFSLHYRLLDDEGYRPALALGLNDMLGTGIYGGEYLVASKRFTPRFSGTLGLGWGRMGSHNGFSNPLGALSSAFKTRPARTGNPGGQFESNQWFRGDAALFGGVEYQLTDQLRVMAEYSSDAQERESGSDFTWRTPLNLGLAYKSSAYNTFTASYLYGSELGLHWSFALNPKQPPLGSGMDPAPQPVVASATAAKSWGGHVTSADLTPRLAKALESEGILLESLQLDGQTLRAQIRNERYASGAQALGRTARVLSAHAPAQIRQFDLRLSHQGMPVTTATLPRAKLESYEFNPVGAELMRAHTRLSATREAMAPRPDLYPRLSADYRPYLRTSLFDPDDPLRGEFGLSLLGRADLGHGVLLAGSINQRLAGTMDKITRTSDSLLPHVRSDSYRYDKIGSTALNEAVGAYYAHLTPALFARATLGYLERGYGGLSTELLWKPQNSRLAIGFELNQLQQRSFTEALGFGDYSVTSGHLSAYYALGNGFTTRLDLGRYLAGDEGATVALNRTFDNGWSVGAYATRTNVSAAEFGEGSFDKGIQLWVPLDWLDGKPSQRRLPITLQALQRDGGAKVSVPGRLYETVAPLQASAIDKSFARFWK